MNKYSLDLKKVLKIYLSIDFLIIQVICSYRNENN